MTAIDDIKHLTCIRHGQSEGNRHNVREYPTAHLSDLGREQARKVAARFHTEIHIDAIFASPYTRAQETAEEIAAIAQAPLYTEQRAYERKLPDVVVGLQRTDPRVQEIVDAVHARYLMRSHERISDEETFDELMDRVDAVMKMIESRPEKHIALVSHQFFLYSVLTWVACRQHPQPEYLLHLYDTFRCMNTSVSHFTFDTKHGWRAVTWNDHSHLWPQ
jgi:broad specificity phosphatase PhoE